MSLRGWLINGLVAIMLLIVGRHTVSGQGVLTPLLSHGPTGNRLNLIVLSEGYQTNQLGQFLIDATNAVNGLLASQPYQAYSNYFNAYAISVASAQSGSDHYSPTTSLVNTYFNSSFDTYGIARLVSIPPNDRQASYAEGEGKVNALLQSLFPEYDLVMLLVNDSQYGGSGGSTLISSLNSSSAEIIRHESGHTLGGLADEYSNAYPGWTPVEYPNATAQTDRGSIYWADWISTNTPLPTPQTAPYQSAIGLFEGAEYQTNYWYRPKYDCKMNHLSVPFCEVCTEQLVKSIYEKIGLIDYSIPDATNVAILDHDTLALRVASPRPTANTISFQWLTNGVSVAGASQSNFVLSAQTVGLGTHSVSVRVHDGTSLVRTDPERLLFGTNTWRVTVTSTALPPAVTSQPLNQNVNPGEAALFSVEAFGTLPLNYQWRFNGTNIVGATASSLAKVNIQYSDAGNYSVTVSNAANTVTSANAVLMVNSPPGIVSQPQNQTVISPNNALFTVGASGTSPLAYQWQFGGTNIVGATASSYQKPNVQLADVGNYRVLVTNSLGSVTSALATLSVNFTLQANATYGGTVSKSPDQISYPANSIVTLTATPVSVFPFTGWSGGLAGNNNPASIVMNSNKTITAQFSSPVADLIIDNPTAAFTGSWATGNSGTDKYGNDYRTAGTSLGSPTATATFIPNITTAGRYDVYVWVPTISKGATAAQFVLMAEEGSVTNSVNESSGSGGWLLLTLGKTFTSGTNGYLRLNNLGPSGKNVVADAARWVYSESQIIPPPIIRSIIPSNGAVVLGWDAIPGRAYSVEYKNRLNDSEWTLLFPAAIATGPSISKTDFIMGSQRYYRVVSQ